MGYKYPYEHKRYYYTFDNSLLFTESIQNTTQIFPMPIITSVSSVSAWRWHNAIRVRAKPCVCIVLIIPGHSQRSSSSGCGHS